MSRDRSERDGGTPAAKSAWPWWAAAGVLALAALWYAGALAGFQQAGAGVSHPLGRPAALVAELAYRVGGLAAWWPVLLLPLGGWMMARQRGLWPFLLTAAAGLWLIPASAALLGLGAFSLQLGGGPWPAGGQGGAALAVALWQLVGRVYAWVICGGLAALGLGVVIWAAWPWLGPFLEPHHYDEGGGDEAAEQPEPEPRPAPQPQPALEPEPSPEPPPAAPAPEPEPESAPEQEPEPAPEPEPEAGPLIRPRAAAPAPSPAAGAVRPEREFSLPPLELLQIPSGQRPPEEEEFLRQNSRLLEEKLADFNVKGKVVEVSPGPVVTMYEFRPAPGVKISKVAGLADDLAMNLKAIGIRIVAPIPGKSVIGIEIPNRVRETVYLREILASPTYLESDSPLTVAMGKDILGAPVVTDLCDMPHLLIAGATGSGKSVFINTLVLSILFRATPRQVRLLMVDPKRIELSTYNDIPHLLYPIITNPQEATAGLRWAVAEMERRYELLARMGVRNIASFNRRLRRGGWPAGQEPPQEEPAGPLPYLVIIIDELSDLMMAASKEVEALITRLAQMARAAGIHLVLATQRPSVDVITGLIKANFPARISFKVTSRVDSRTILDQQGAEHLLGKGDLLFIPPGAAGLRRLHAAYVSDREIEAVAEFIKAQAAPDYDESIVQSAEDENGFSLNGEEVDERYADAVALVKRTGQASISFVQRKLRVGYNRAARMIEQMEAEGIVGPSDGSRPREVLIRD